MDSRQIPSGGLGNGRREADSGQIKADIDDTRERIDGTLEALADKLHPKHLLDEAVDYLRSPGQGSSTASKLGHTVWQHIQEHPMPSLLIGAGIAWMLSERKRKVGTEVGYPSTSSGSWANEGDGGEWGPEATSEHLESSSSESGPSIGEKTAALGHRVKAKTSELADTVKSKTGELAESVKAKTGELAGSVREKSGEIAQSIKEKTYNIKESGVEQATRLKEATRTMSTQTRERAGAVIHRAEQTLSEATDNYPLAIGFGFLAIGVLAGLALPHSRLEDRTLGPRADQLKDKGRQAVESAKRAATAVATTATDEAQRQGLTPHSLGEKIQHIASETVRAASDAAHREGLDQESLGHQVQAVASEAKKAAQQELGQTKEQMPRPV